MAGRIARALEAGLLIRPGERRRVALMSLYAANAIGAVVIGHSVRDALYLSNRPARGLAGMYIWSSIAIVLVSWFYARIADRLPRGLLNAASAIGCAALGAGPQGAGDLARRAHLSLQQAPDHRRPHRRRQRSGSDDRRLPVQALRSRGARPERPGGVLRPLLWNLRRRGARGADLGDWAPSRTIRDPRLAASPPPRSRARPRRPRGERDPRPFRQLARQGLRLDLPLHHQRCLDAAVVRARCAPRARARQGIHRRRAQADLGRVRRRRAALLQAVRWTRTPAHRRRVAARRDLGLAPDARPRRVRPQPGRVARAKAPRSLQLAVLAAQRGDHARAAHGARWRTGYRPARAHPRPAAGAGSGR